MKNFKKIIKSCLYNSKTYSTEYKSIQVEKLNEKLLNSPHLTNKLQHSLKLAKEKGRKYLNIDLFNELSWPTNTKEYEKYLNEFVKYIPKESESKIWKKMKGINSYTQEIYDRLCHFYYLIDQPLEKGKLIENDEWFKFWLVEFINEWGFFLDTPNSINDEIYDSFKNNKLYKVENSLIMGPNEKLIPNSPR
jgi:phosphatidylserine decarboxylase